MKRQYELLQVGDSNIIAEGKCIYTGEAYRTAPFTLEGWQSWRYLRIPIQDALPELEAHDREFLMSGFSPVGWEEFYGTDDE